MREGINKLIEYMVTPHLKRVVQGKGSVKIYLPEDTRNQLNGKLMECFQVEGAVPQIDKYTGDIKVSWWELRSSDVF